MHRKECKESEREKQVRGYIKRVKFRSKREGAGRSQCETTFLLSHGSAH